MEINGAALKAIRSNCGHTQSSLAKASEVDQGNISKMEAQKDGPVTVRPSTAKKLADALAVPIAALIIPERIEEAS